MSNKRKGQLTTDDEWRKHLRKIGKRIFWKGERLAEKKVINKEVRQSEQQELLVGDNTNKGREGISINP